MFKDTQANDGHGPPPAMAHAPLHIVAGLSQAIQPHFPAAASQGIPSRHGRPTPSGR